MKTNQTTRWVLLALLMALTIVCGRFFLVPIPWTHGNVNLSDASILITAALFGPVGGGLVGGLGTAFLDLISGYAQYAPFSFLAHGLEGLVAGGLFRRFGRKKWGQWLAFAVGGLMMVLGYFLADSILYTWVAGALGIATNLLQAAIGIVVAVVVLPALQRRMK